MSLRSVQLTDYIYRKASRARVPLSGTFEVSPVCNLSCKMCYVRRTPGEVAQSPRRQMTLEEWLALARQAREAGMLFVLLTGGEPLLWPHFWELYEQLIAMGFVVSVNTNGTLIDEAAVERLKKMPPKRLNITLYGADDETYYRLCGTRGMFDKVDGAIRALTEAGVLVKLNGSFTPYNVCDMDKIIAYARELGLQIDTTTYMFPPVRRCPEQFGENDRFTPEEAARHRVRCVERMNTYEQYAAYLRAVRAGVVEPPGLDEGCIDPVDGRIRCRAGKSAFWVTWDGWMTACGMMPEPKCDLRQMEFGDAWETLCEASSEIRLSGICDGCANQQLCHTCAAIAYCETGHFSGIPQYLCRMARQMRVIAEEELEILLPKGNQDMPALGGQGSSRR